MLQFDNSEAVLSLGDFLVDLDKPLQIYIEQQQELEEEESDSFLDQNRSAANETVLISENQSAAGREELTIAPGENKKVDSFLRDQYCEELAQPYLFPTGKFGYKVKREIPCSVSKYFNQRLLNYSQVFASDSDYIFCTCSSSENTAK